MSSMIRGPSSSQVRRRRMRDVRQHLAHVGRHGHVAAFHQRVPRAVGLRLVDGFALRALRGVGDGPVQVAADEHARRAEVLHVPGQIRHVDRPPQRHRPKSPSENRADDRTVADARNYQGLADDLIVPGDREAVAPSMTYSQCTSSAAAAVMNVQAALPPRSGTSRGLSPCGPTSAVTPPPAAGWKGRPSSTCTQKSSSVPVAGV